jgi:hypothetical protein
MPASPSSAVSRADLATVALTGTEPFVGEDLLISHGFGGEDFVAIF